MEEIPNFQVPAEGLELVIFTFEKNLNFSEKMPTEGLEMVILLHTQITQYIVQFKLSSRCPKKKKSGNES